MKTHQTKLTVIVLAAGQGSRMHSTLPKPLHPVAGIPMIARVIQAVKVLKQKGCDLEIRVVIGQKGGQQIKDLLSSDDIFYIEQNSPKGTGHAVQVACNVHPLESEFTLIMNADHPLITSDHITSLWKHFIEKKMDLAVVTAVMEDPGSLGRVVRQGEHIHKIVESGDADEKALSIKEVNAGIYVTRNTILYELLPYLSSSKNQVYLTDLIPLFREKKQKNILGIEMPEDVAFGVNSQQDLANATQKAFQRKNQQLMNEGVILMDPQTTYIEDDVKIQSETLIHPNNFLKGKSQIGKSCLIESNCFLQDVLIEDEVQVKAGSYLEHSRVGHHSLIGPYARLRPQTHIGHHCKIGNFVELKNAKLADHVKASHLSYLGDVDVGSNVNIGCGVITCNYREDHKKYKTLIAKGVFVGSDVQLIAPVKVGQGAIIGSGSTITKDVPEGSLALSRAEQVIKPRWAIQKRQKHTE